MAEEHKGYMQNRAIPMVFCPFSECPLSPVWACGISRDTKWLLGWVFLGAWHGGARGWAEIPQLLRRLRRTWLPASPSPMFGQKLVCGQEKSGTLAEFGMGGKKKKVFCSAACAEGCARAGAGLSPLQRERVGFGSRNECCALFTNRDVAFSWQGHSRVENVGILVSASHGLAAFVCHRE